MWARTASSTIAFASVLVGGCLGAGGVASQPPEGAKPRPVPAPAATFPAEPAPPSPHPAGAAAPVTPPREAIATPNAGNGHVELVIEESGAACGPYLPFPSNCEPTWRIRIDLTPADQRPGVHALGPGLSPFAYRDAQGPPGGVWQKGTTCENLGDNVVGTLEILAIDERSISGVLSGAGKADGPFHARRCPSCKGTGNACTSNGECCNDFCHSGRCQP
jgi:hypothetical protein